MSLSPCHLARSLVTVVLALATVSCTMRDSYAAAQSIGASKARCNERLTQADQQRCMAAYERKYEDYVRERAAAVSTASNQ